MEAVIFIGLQGSGKSTFYKQRFSDSHVRINLDMLRTRHREKVLLEACLQTGQRFVIDNTNPRSEDRARYIGAAKNAGFQIFGYYFQSQLEACKQRNAGRGTTEIPLLGVLGTYGRLQLPTRAEGFDVLHYVRIGSDGGFIVEDWKDEV